MTKTHPNVPNSHGQERTLPLLDFSTSILRSKEVTGPRNSNLEVHFGAFHSRYSHTQILPTNSRTAAHPWSWWRAPWSAARSSSPASLRPNSVNITKSSSAANVERIRVERHGGSSARLASKQASRSASLPTDAVAFPLLHLDPGKGLGDGLWADKKLTRKPPSRVFACARAHFVLPICVRAMRAMRAFVFRVRHVSDSATVPGGRGIGPGPANTSISDTASPSAVLNGSQSGENRGEKHVCAGQDDHFAHRHVAWECRRVA